MTLRQEQFVVDKEGNRIGVVLNIEDYQKLLADVEELKSIRALSHLILLLTGDYNAEL